MPGVDVLVVSLGSTAGLRTSDAELLASLRRAGASAELAVADPQRDVRTFALTDLLWARAARRAAARGIAAHEPRAVIYSTVTASLLWPRPGAVRLDAVSAVNRPGRHGVWQRPLERRRLAQATLLVPTCLAALQEGGLERSPAVIVPIAITASGPACGERPLSAITYAANPVKKGLDRVLEAWSRARREGEQLTVAGLDESSLAQFASCAQAGAGVRAVGRLAPESYRQMLRRARVYVSAPRREDYGIAQLEALADGCQLVTTAAPGPYAALAVARELDPRLVGNDLAAALRVALDDPRPDYAARARVALAPFSSAAVDAVVAERLLPALLD